MASFTTLFRNKGPVKDKVWWKVDAKNQHVGRVASQISRVLQGKYKPAWHPAVDNGDYIVITNAQDIVFTGKKWTQKLYRWHTGWMGGLKSIPADALHRKNPTEVLKRAIWGMLPTGQLRRRWMKRLLIYPGTAHPHGDKPLKQYNLLKSEGLGRYLPNPNTKHTSLLELKLTRKDDGFEMSTKTRPVNNSRAALRKASSDGLVKPQAITHGNPVENNLPGFRLMGPALTSAEMSYIGDLIDRGYNGEGWPVEPGTPVGGETSAVLSEQHKAFLAKMHAKTQKTHAKAAKRFPKLLARASAQRKKKQTEPFRSW